MRQLEIERFEKFGGWKPGVFRTRRVAKRGGEKGGKGGQQRRRSTFYPKERSRFPDINPMAKGMASRLCARACVVFGGSFSFRANP
jgi:hypothetical protein